LLLTKDNVPSIEKITSQESSLKDLISRGFDTIVGAGPTLVWNGEDISDVAYWEEGFDKGLVDSTKQLALGIRDRFLFVIVGDNLSGKDAAKELVSLKCVRGFCLAGVKCMFAKYSGRMLSKSLLRPRQYAICFTPSYLQGESKNGEEVS
jgi:hypothetical protein